MKLDHVEVLLGLFQHRCGDAVYLAGTLRHTFLHLHGIHIGICVAGVDVSEWLIDPTRGAVAEQTEPDNNKVFHSIT